MVFPRLTVRNDLILLCRYCLHPWDVLISIAIHLEGSAEAVKEMLIIISRGDPWGIMLGLRNHEIAGVTPQSGIKVMSSAPFLCSFLPLAAWGTALTGSPGALEVMIVWWPLGHLSIFCLILVLILS